MSGAGIQKVLWTKQPASANNIARATALSKKDPTFMFVADDPQVVHWMEESATAAKTKLKVAFGAPRALEGHAILACRAALAMHEAVRAVDQAPAEVVESR